MESPLVSFVIPVFNNENDIARCLRSIQNQCVTGETCEIVILDNGSTDQTHRIMNELGFAFHVMPKVTVSTLRNRGAALARGRYLAFVDSDVELSRSGYRMAYECLMILELSPVAVSPACLETQHGCSGRGTCISVDLYVDLTPRPISWLSSMNLIVRRDTFLAIGGFNERLQTAEDVDLGYRLGQRGTILCNPAMDAVHWGEARDLKIFWRKEVWRGLGNLGGVRSHGLRWDEVTEPWLSALHCLFGDSIDFGDRARFVVSAITVRPRNDSVAPLACAVVGLEYCSPCKTADGAFPAIDFILRIWFSACVRCDENVGH